MRHFSRAFAAVALLAAACGPTEGSPDGGTDGGSTITCENDPRVVAFTPGLSASSASGAVKLVVDKGDPAVPSRGTNTWTVRFLDADGKPLKGAAIDVQPFMPDHGHGSPQVPQATENADGTWTVTPLYLFMPGVWQITFRVTPAGGSQAQVAVGICIAG